MDRSVEPHLLGSDVWFDQFGFRTRNGKISQFARKTAILRTAEATTYYVTAIVAIPTGFRSNNNIVAFHPGFLSWVDPTTPAITVLPGDNTFVPTTDRWAAKIYGRRVYFTNLSNPVAWSDGTIVKKFTTSVPAARYIEIFYDHLVVANTLFNGTRFPLRVMWSDLYKVGDWTPKRSNEADHYDCEQSAFPGGWPGEITGLARIGDFLGVYTPTTIYLGKYVGLPHVMRLDPLGLGVGCDFLYGLVSTESAHFFPSFKNKDFYMFNGGAVKSVGEKIREFFFNDILDSSKIRQETWGFYDQENEEVGWVYKNISGQTYNQFNRAVILNIRTGVWYRAPVEDVSCLSNASAGKFTIDSLAGFTYASIVSSGYTSETLCAEGLSKLWGSSNGRILKETTSISSAEQVELPFLEAPDLVGGNLDKIKEVESMVIHASGSLSLSVAKRSLVDDAVSLVAQTQIWTPLLKEKRLTFPRVSGRVLRYRFTPTVPPGGTATPTVPEIALRVALFEQVLAQKSFVVDGSGPVAGRFYPPKVGVYAVILIGSGGGGGARAILTTNTFAWVDSATQIAIRGVTQQKLKRKWRGTSASFFLQDYFANDGIDLSGLYPVYIPDVAGGDPHGYATMSTAYKQTLYDAAAAFVKQQIALAGNTFNGYLIFRFEKVASGGAKGFLWTTWLTNGRTLSVMPANVWRVGVDAVSLTSVQRELQSGGGGSGAFVAGYLTFNAVTEYADYRVGTALDQTTDGSNTTGAIGGHTTVWNDAIGFSIRAQGGAGAVPSGVDITDGTGGGTVIVAAGRFVTAVAAGGVSAVREAPTSGAPITTAAKSGSAVNKDNVRHIPISAKQKGKIYGGGGCGQSDDFDTNLKATKGADGYIEFRWLDDTVARAPGLPFDVSTTNVRIPTGVQAIGPVTNLINPATFKVHVNGVMEGVNYTGGSVINSFCKLNPTAPGTTRCALLLKVGTDKYYLNHLATGNYCLRLSYNFFVVVASPATISLEIVPAASADMYDPRKQDGTPLFPSSEFDGYRPQWAVVSFEQTGQGNSQLVDYEFSAYVDNLYDGKAEQ